MKVSSTRYLSATTRPLKLRRTPRHFGLPCHFVSIMVSWLARTYSEGSVGRPLIFIPMLVGPKAIEYVFVIPHCYLCTLLIQNTFISFMGCFIIKLVSEAAFLTPMHTHQDTQQPDSWVMEMSPEINQWLPRSSGFPRAATDVWASLTRNLTFLAASFGWTDSLIRFFSRQLNAYLCILMKETKFTPDPE